MIRKTLTAALTFAVLSGSALVASTASSEAGYYGGGYGGGYGGYYGGGYGGYHCYTRKIRVYGYYGYHWKRIRVCG